jgi:hypothetical protein
MPSVRRVPAAAGSSVTKTGRKAIGARYRPRKLPIRLLLSSSLNYRFEFDSNIVTKSEVKFIPQNADETRVELEHSHFERTGETAEALHRGVDSPEDWSKSPERFAQIVVSD